MTTTTEAEGLRIRQWRHHHKLTLKQLAKHLGVAWLTVQRWETGQRSVPSFLHLALERLDELLLARGGLKRDDPADPW